MAADDLSRATMPIPALGPQTPSPTPPPADQPATGGATPAAPASGAAPAPAPAPAPAVAAPSGDAASLNLDHLAKSIRRLSNGEGLGSKLSAAGETGYGSTVSGLIRGGILVDEYA
jgi:hypothetical protein